MSRQEAVKAKAVATHAKLERHLRSEVERAQIAELEAAGISRFRIASLYPGEILDLAPHLEVLMRKNPIPPEATRLDESLVELSTRSWTFFTLHGRHAQQVMSRAFSTEQERTGYIDYGKGQRVAVVEAMNLRMLFALLELIKADAFEGVGGELPWVELSKFLEQAEHTVSIADEVLTNHPLLT